MCRLYKSSSDETTNRESERERDRDRDRDRDRQTETDRQTDTVESMQLLTELVNNSIG